MANKLITRRKLKHYYDEQPTEPKAEPDKTKSIAELDGKELRAMIRRLGSERELQSLIRELKRNSGERDTYDQPFTMNTITPINQLYHHGVKGMKWGVRRYQNTDGTRTAAGRRRRDSQDGRSSSEESSRPKNVKSLSNEELKKLNERIQLEDTYKRLTSAQVKSGKSWVNKSLSSASEQALTEFSKGLMLGSAKLLVKGLSPSLAEAGFSIKEQKKKG